MKVPGSISIIEGFLYPFLRIGPIDFVTTAPAPPSNIRFILE